jgi:hypothetical protein
MTVVQAVGVSVALLAFKPGASKRFNDTPEGMSDEGMPAHQQSRYKPPGPVKASSLQDITAPSATGKVDDKPVAGNRAMDGSLAHVSSTSTRSSHERCCPKMPSTLHVWPLTHVLSCDSGLTPISVNLPTSTRKSSGLAYEMLSAIGNAAIQHSRYAAPAAVTSASPQVTCAPEADTEDAKPEWLNRGSGESVPHVSKTMK